MSAPKFYCKLCGFTCFAAKDFERHMVFYHKDKAWRLRWFDGPQGAFQE